MNEIYGIAFKNGGKIYNFSGNSDIYNISDEVIVETEKGHQFGIVVEKNVKINNKNIKSIIRIANEKDKKQYLKNIKDSEQALIKAQSFADDLDIEMNIVDASYTFDRRQLLFNFIASERVDFRELVKMLASEYHTRIELRQIGVRDKAKLIGGIGQCGREQCCTCFLETIDSITINMAKNQDIALNPNKINGACGRLLCCLTYEDETYSENRKSLPKVGEFINTEHGKGKVESINILEKKYTISINNDKYEIDCKNIQNCPKFQNNAKTTEQKGNNKGKRNR